MPVTIKHLVGLMMENRYFDHMLGFMQSPTYGIDGLDRDSSGEPVRVNNNTGDLPNHPSHDFEDVMEQMFGIRSPAAGQQPDMSGFVKNYERFNHDRVKASAIMNCFDPTDLPVLATLASSYVVCDRWFSSVPAPTLPNRVLYRGLARKQNVHWILLVSESSLRRSETPNGTVRAAARHSEFQMRSRLGNVY